MLRIAIQLGTVVAVAALTGCRTPPGTFLAPGQSEYFAGELTALEKARFTDVVPATKKAMFALGLKPFLVDHDGHSASYHGSSSNGKDVFVWLERESENTTEIGIRMLFTRDAARLRQILEEIRKRLDPDESDEAVVRADPLH